MESKTEQLVRRCFIKIDKGPIPIHQYYFGKKRLETIPPDIFHVINSIEKEKGDQTLLRINLGFLSIYLECCELGDKFIKDIFFLDLPNQLELLLSMIYYYLCKNDLTDVGCSSLLLANWVQNLISLDLCINLIIKPKITSHGKAVYHCLK